MDVELTVYQRMRLKTMHGAHKPLTADEIYNCHELQRKLNLSKDELLRWNIRHSTEPGRWGYEWQPGNPCLAEKERMELTDWERMKIAQLLWSPGLVSVDDVDEWAGDLMLNGGPFPRPAQS